MRKLLFFCIFLFACQKPVQRPAYILTLKYDEYHRGIYNPTVEKDSIRAKNDTVAFRKAFERYSNEVTTSKFIDSGNSIPMRKNISFKLVDKNGVNVQEKLSKPFVDSVEAKINKQFYDIFNSFKHRKSN